MSATLPDYYLYNIETKEVVGSDYVSNPTKTPFIYSTVKGPQVKPCFCVYIVEGSEGPWDYTTSSDPRLPKEFITSLMLLGVPFTLPEN